jgi:hypothetical protein
MKSVRRTRQIAAAVLPHAVWILELEYLAYVQLRGWLVRRTTAAGHRIDRRTARIPFPRVH